MSIALWQIVLCAVMLISGLWGIFEVVFRAGTKMADRSAWEDVEPSKDGVEQELPAPERYHQRVRR